LVLGEPYARLLPAFVDGPALICAAAIVNCSAL
jgi:hypothetical protein